MTASGWQVLTHVSDGTILRDPSWRGPWLVIVIHDQPTTTNRIHPACSHPLSTGRRSSGTELVAQCQHDGVTTTIDGILRGIDWTTVKAHLAADDFDNGRTPAALRRSFVQSQHVAIARDGDRVVGMARMLSDGVCNAYLLDVWTASTFRRRGIASSMIRFLADQVPGQHIGLQTDADAFYASLGFREQPTFMSLVVGTWLSNDANTATDET